MSQTDQNLPLTMHGLDENTIEALQRTSDRQLRALADAMPHIVWAARADGFFDYFNRRYFEYTGSQEKDFYTQTWRTLIHPDDVGPFLSAWQTCITSHDPLELEFRFRRSDGQFRWHLARARPELTETGTVERWYGTYIDIHDRKQTEVALRRSEREFRELADAMPQIVFAATPDGQIYYYNQRWFDYTGLSPDDPTAWGSAKQVIHPLDFAATINCWQHCMQSGNFFEIEYRFLGRQGDYRWHLGRAAPVYDEQGRITRWYGTSTDIDDHKQVETALAGVAIQKDLLFAEAHHRIKNSLQMVMSLLDLQAKRLPDAAAKDSLYAARSRVRTIAQIHQRLYATEDVTTIEMGEYLRAISEDFTATSTMAGQTKLSFTTDVLDLDVDKAIPLALIANELLTNAFKHGAPNGAGIVSLKLKNGGDYLLLTVTDNGNGVQPGASTSGTGIGMRLIEGLTQQLGAAIEMTNAVTGGTEVSVRMPLSSAFPPSSF